MGVDFYSCQSCGHNFPDCGPYEWCGCGKNWCCEDCASDDGLNKDDENAPKYNEGRSCDFCRGDDFEDSTLLAYALEELGKSRAELVELVKSKKKIA